MVFSQTSLDSPPVLKVVNLDRLKTEKNNHVNGQTGVITDGYSSTTAPSSPVATTSSFAEVRMDRDTVSTNRYNALLLLNKIIVRFSSQSEIHANIR